MSIRVNKAPVPRTLRLSCWSAGLRRCKCRIADVVKVRKCPLGPQGMFVSFFFLPNDILKSDLFGNKLRREF